MRESYRADSIGFPHFAFIAEISGKNRGQSLKIGSEPQVRKSGVRASFLSRYGYRVPTKSVYRGNQGSEPQIRVRASFLSRYGYRVPTKSVYRGN